MVGNGRHPWADGRENQMEGEGEPWKHYALDIWSHINYFMIAPEFVDSLNWINWSEIQCPTTDPI